MKNYCCPENPSRRQFFTKHSRQYNFHNKIYLSRKWRWLFKKTHNQTNYSQYPNLSSGFVKKPFIYTNQSRNILFISPTEPFQSIFTPLKNAGEKKVGANFSEEVRPPFCFLTRQKFSLWLAFPITTPLF